MFLRAEKDTQDTAQQFRICTHNRPPSVPIIKRLHCFKRHRSFEKQRLWAYLFPPHKGPLSRMKPLPVSGRSGSGRYSQNCRLRLTKASSAARASSSKKRLRKSILISSICSSWFHLQSGTRPANKTEAINMCSEVENQVCQLKIIQLAQSSSRKHES